MAALIASANPFGANAENTTPPTHVNNPEGNSFGCITGRITDQESHSLPGATVVVENLHTGVTSDINGFYTQIGRASCRERV